VSAFVQCYQHWRTSHPDIVDVRFFYRAIDKSQQQKKTLKRKNENEIVAITNLRKKAFKTV